MDVLTKTRARQVSAPPESPGLRNLPHLASGHRRKNTGWRRQCGQSQPLQSGTSANKIDNARELRCHRRWTLLACVQEVVGSNPDQLHWQAADRSAACVI